MSVADGDTLYTLSAVIAVTEDRRGNIYVTQQGVPYVAVFDAQGLRIATLGSSGGGPGEFANPGRVSIVRDSIWIDDFGLRKFSQFAPDFRHVRDVVVDADYPEIRSSVSAAEFAGIAPIAVTDHGFVIELRTHEVTRQLVQPWTGAAKLIGQFPIGDLLARFATGNRRMTAVKPVMVYPFLVARGERLVRVQRDTVFRVTQFSGTGTQVTSVSPALERTRPSRQWIEAYFDRVVEQFKARTPSSSRREIRRAYEDAISVSA